MSQANLIAIRDFMQSIGNHLDQLNAKERFEALEKIADYYTKLFNQCPKPIQARDDDVYEQAKKAFEKITG